MDELQELWNKERSEDPKSPPDFKLGKRSSGLIEKLRLSLIYEYRFNLFGGPLAVGMLLYLGYRDLSIILAVLLVPLIMYYRYLLREIREFDLSGNITETVGKTYRILRVFIFRYRALCWLLIPVSMYYGYIEGSAEPVSGAEEVPLYILAGLLLLGGLMIIGLLELYIYVIYGRYLKSLKSILEDLRS